MKKVLILLSLLACFFCACQPTPQEDIVMNRQTEATAPALGGDANSYSYPSEWRETFESSGLEYTIYMEANVDGFSLVEYPVYPLYPTNFTGEDVRRIFSTLVGNVNLCVYQRDMDGNNIPIKGTMDAEIEELIDQITNFDVYHKDDDFTEAGREYMLASLQEELDEAKSNYKRAVDAKYTTDYDDLCEPQSSNEGEIFDSNDSWVGSFDVSHGDNDRSKVVIVSMKDSISSAPYGEFQTPNTDVEAGQRMCEDILSKLGLSDFVLNKITQKEGADQATYYFTRSCDGYPYSSAIYSTPLVGLDGVELKYLYEPFWYDEFIMMIPGTYGISYFMWQSKSTVGEPTRTVQLLPFEEIQKEFRKDIGYVTEYYENKAGEERGIVVTDMQLGYKRVPVRDAYGSYELVPVWTFTGYYTSETMKNIFSEELLILNAVDGSIVG